MIFITKIKVNEKFECYIINLSICYFRLVMFLAWFLKD